MITHFFFSQYLKCSCINSKQKYIRIENAVQVWTFQIAVYKGYIHTDTYVKFGVYIVHKNICFIDKFLYLSTMENSKVFILFSLSRKKRNFLCVFVFERTEREREKGILVVYNFLSIFLSFFLSFMRNCWFFMYEIDNLCNLTGHDLLIHSLDPVERTKINVYSLWYTVLSMHKGCVYVLFYDPNALFPFSLTLSVLISFKYNFCIYFFLLLLLLLFLCLLISKQHFLFFKFYMSL